jgi:fimbrial chaperone protein
MVSAFELKPLYANLKPNGPAAEQVFRITNNHNNPIAVQFKMTTRQQHANGTETKTPADDLFMVYPPQAVIPVNGTQKVRVQWLGTPNPNKELAYRLVAEQVPVTLNKDKKSGVQMVMTVVGSVYIVPDGVAPALQVSQLHRRGNQLAFTVSNNGTQHAMLNNLQIQLSNGAQNLQLNGTQVTGANGKNVLAGSSRQLNIPYPQGVSIDASWQVNLQYSR